MNAARKAIPGCRIPSATGECLQECVRAGSCRAGTLRMVDGRAYVGEPLGIVGDTLRFRSVFPVRGPVLLSFAEVEPLSLHEALRACTDPADGVALQHLAEAAAARGLVDLALRELERALQAAPARERALRAARDRILADAARRCLADARSYLDAHLVEHARAALDEVVSRFPGTPGAEEARRLRRTLVEATA